MCMDTCTIVEKKSRVRAKGGGGGRLQKQRNSVRDGLLVVGDTDALCGDRRAADHLHPPAAAKKVRERSLSSFQFIQQINSNTNTNMIKVCL